MRGVARGPARSGAAISNGRGSGSSRRIPSRRRRPRPRPPARLQTVVRAEVRVDRRVRAVLASSPCKRSCIARTARPTCCAARKMRPPIPAGDEVLINVHAASVNPFDWHFMRGEPYLLRLMTGLGKPKNPRLGADVAGTVAAVGRDVTQLRAGDEVFGACRGSFTDMRAPLCRGWPSSRST